jgi:hypothetical protein
MVRVSLERTENSRALIIRKGSAEWPEFLVDNRG